MSNAELINATIASAIEAMHSHNPVQNLQAIPVLNTNDPTTKIRAIHETHAKLQMIEVRLDLITADCARDSINKLDIAMLKLYKVAIFVRGDYDGRDEDKEQRNSLLQAAVQAFQDVEDCSEAGLKKISELHAEVGPPPSFLLSRSSIPCDSASDNTLDG